MSDITPEKVAATLAKSTEEGWRFDLEAALSLTAEGSVLNLAVTRWQDDEEGTEVVRHFRAVVVEGEETPLVLEWPEELGLSWQDGGDLLTLDSSGLIRLNPRGVDEWELSPEEALEMAAQLAAMAALAKRADDLEGVAFGGTTLPEAAQADQKGGTE